MSRQQQCLPIEKSLKVSHVLSTFLMRRRSSNMKLSSVSNTFQERRKLLITMLSNTKLSTSLRFIKTSTSSTSHKRDSKRELNTKPSRSKLSTSPFKKHSKCLFNKCLLLNSSSAPKFNWSPRAPLPTSLSLTKQSQSSKALSIRHQSNSNYSILLTLCLFSTQIMFKGLLLLPTCKKLRSNKLSLKKKRKDFSRECLIEHAYFLWYYYHFFGRN